MNLQKLFQDAQMSIKHGLAPIKATMLAAAILTVTGVFSVGLFSLLALSLCLYNAGRRTLSMYLESPKGVPISTPLATDSQLKANEILTISKKVAQGKDPRMQLTQCGQALEAGIHFIGGEVKSPTLKDTASLTMGALL